MTKSDLLDKINRDEFLTAYLEAALWSSTTMGAGEKDGEPYEEGTPLDDIFYVDDFQFNSLKGLVEQAQDFEASEVVEQASDALDGLDYEQLGHDFWLTQNGHGAGFWDGGWPEPWGKKLTDAAHVYGGIDLYEANGKVYASGYEDFKSGGYSYQKGERQPAQNPGIGATELVLHGDNTRSLYKMKQSIQKNLINKMAADTYSSKLAVKGWLHFADAAAKSYSKEFGGTWHQSFPKPDRVEAAEEWAEQFEAAADCGELDYMLHKKYQR